MPVRSHTILGYICLSFTLCALILSLVMAELAHAETFDDSVKKETITDAVSLDGLSLRDNQRTGFMRHGWQRSRAVFAATALDALTVKPTLPSLEKLQHAMLLSGIHAPHRKDHAKTPHLFFSLRLKLLARMGDASSIRRLIAKIPHTVDANPFKPYVVAAHITSGEVEKACEYVKTHRMKESFWRESVLFCGMYFNQKNSIELDVSLMKEEGIALSDVMAETLATYEAQEDPKVYIATAWKKQIAQTLLAFHKKQKQITQPSYVKSSPLSAFYTYTWWNAVDALPIREKLQELTLFYTLLTHRHVKVPYQEWEEIAYSAMHENIAIPQEVLHHLLNRAVAEERQAEGVLLVLYTLQHLKTQRISASTWEHILSSLHSLGFSATANKLFGEGIFSDKRVRSYGDSAR